MLLVPLGKQFAPREDDPFSLCTSFSVASITRLESLVGWERKRGGRVLTAPLLVPRKRPVERCGRSGKVLSVGFFSGLVTQSEIDDLLDMLYGSYGERLIVSYKRAS